MIIYLHLPRTLEAPTHIGNGSTTSDGGVIADVVIFVILVIMCIILFTYVKRRR